MMIYRIYAALLRLYPRQFRTDFGNEMEEVFHQAASRIKPKTLPFLIRELRDFPGSLFRQYWLAIQKEKVPMNTLAQSNGSHTETHQPGTWGAVILAVLPHLLMSALIALGRFSVFDDYEMDESVSIILGIFLVLLVIILLVLVWRRGFPLWSASWYLYGTWVIVAILSLAIDKLNLEESWRYSNFLFVSWIVLCIVGYFIVVSKSRLHGLLSVAFLFPVLGLMFLEFIPNPIEGWLAIGLGCIIALAVAVIVRSGNPQMGFLIVLGSNIIAGVTLAYVSEYWMLDLPSRAPLHVPKFSNFLELLGFYSIFGLGVVALPFILRGLFNLGKRRFSS